LPSQPRSFCLRVLAAFLVDAKLAAFLALENPLREAAAEALGQKRRLASAEALADAERVLAGLLLAGLDSDRGHAFACQTFGFHLPPSLVGKYATFLKANSDLANFFARFSEPFKHVSYSQRWMDHESWQQTFAATEGWMKTFWCDCRNLLAVAVAECLPEDAQIVAAICCWTLIRLAWISTLIVLPSTIPVMRPWIATCSRPKVYVAGLSASWPRTPRTPQRTSKAMSLVSIGSGLREH
jgi:hypothetical protein